MKKTMFSVAIMVLMSACSGLPGIDAGGEDDMEVSGEAKMLSSVYISRCSAQATLDAGYAGRLFPSNATLKINRDDSGKKADLLLHYDFYPENGSSEYGYFELELKAVPFSEEGSRMVFGCDSLEGIVSLDSFNEALPFTEVKVSGSMNLLENALSSTFAVSGYLNGYPFVTRVDKLAAEKPDYSPYERVKSDFVDYRTLVTNKTGKSISLEFHAAGIGRVLDSYTIKPGESLDIFSEDNLLVKYDTVITSEDGVSKKVEDWAALSLTEYRDFNIVNDEGRINPHYFDVLSSTVVDGFLEGL